MNAVLAGRLPAAPVALSAEGLTLAYPGMTQPVLRDVSLQVRRGEIISLLGPSGVGKSSLLRILAGLEHPVAGHVTMHGEVLDRVHPRLAISFQDPCLLPWLTVEQNVAFGLDFRHQPDLPRTERQTRVTAALGAVSLAHAGRQRPAELSGGMAQRVALARCLARRPEVLLLDEPFGALDEVTRTGMQHLLSDLVARSGAATVLITHDIDEALLLSDRVLLLGGAPAAIVGEWPIDHPRPRDALVTELGLLRIEILRRLRDTSLPR